MMYWVDLDKTRIEQAAMGGTQRKSLVVNHDEFPTLADLTTNIQGIVPSRYKGIEYYVVLPFFCTTIDEVK